MAGFDLNSIILYAFGFLGIVLIFLTRYVMKGKARDMTGLWFVTFFGFIVFYSLAGTRLLTIGSGSNIGFAILWPIPAILSAWIADKLTDKESTKLPVFNWLTLFLAGVIFAILVDTGASMFGWYTYNPAITAGLITNPLTGQSTPAIVLLMMGFLLMVLGEMVARVKRMMGRKFYNTQNTLLICGVAVLFGAIAWTITDIMLGVV